MIHKKITSTLYANIDSVKSIAPSRHMDDMPGINSAMQYVGGANTLLPHHAENELPSMSYTTTGNPSFWYVSPRAFRLFAEQLLHLQFPNSHHGAVKQILGRINAFLNPLILFYSSLKMKLFRVVQRSNTFVVLGLIVLSRRVHYWIQFCTGNKPCRLLLAHFGKFLGRQSRASTSVLAVYSPLRCILWKEVVSLIEINNEALPDETRKYPMNLKLANLCRLSKFFSNEERKPIHFLHMTAVT